MAGSAAAAPLGLAFSGGGFRATLFHVGVLLVLLKNKLLRDDSPIVGVSGGAILAAHLAWRWGEYTAGSGAPFAEDKSRRACLGELLAVMRADLRNRVLRRCILFHLLWVTTLVLSVTSVVLYAMHERTMLVTFVAATAAAAAAITLFVLWLRRAVSSSLTTLLEAQYESLLYVDYPTRLTRRPITLGQIRPQTFLAATSLTTGDLVAFDGERVRVFRSDGSVVQAARKSTETVARAVCCSSAFPPLFHPVHAPKEYFGGADGPDHRLTDGGVHDNLGVDLMRLVAPNLREAVIADAGQPLANSGATTFRWTVARNVRANDLLMYRVAAGDLRQSLHRYQQAAVCHIHYAADADRHEHIDGDVQLQVAQTRTDLDWFSEDEIYALVWHGAATAMRQLHTASLWKDRTPATTFAGPLREFHPITGGEIALLCGLSGTWDECENRFKREHQPSPQNWRARTWHLATQLRRLLLARDWPCLGWLLIPLALALMVGWYVHDHVWQHCPANLAWTHLLTSETDSTLAILAQDVAAPERVEGRQYVPLIRQSIPLAEACGGRNPSSFSIRVSHVKDGQAIVSCLAYLQMAGPTPGGRGYRPLRKTATQSGEGDTFLVLAPSRDDQVIVIIRVPSQGLQAGAVALDQRLSAEQLGRLLGPIEVLCP